MNREHLKQVHPDLASEIEDILWHGYDGSVVVIGGKQELLVTQCMVSLKEEEEVF